MKKMKIVLLLVALLAFSSELFAENNVTDSNVSLSSNDMDDLFDELESLDEEYKKVEKRKEQLENILLGS